MIFIREKVIKRLRVFSFICGVFFCILFARVIYMQLIHGNYYLSQSDENRLRQTKIFAARGMIYDSKGRELVNNYPGYAIALQRRKSYSDDLLERLSRVVGLSVEMIKARIQQNKDSYEPIILRTHITPQMLTKFEEERKNLSNVLLMVYPERKYIYNNFGVHTIGYVGEVSEYEIENKLYNDVTVGSIVGKSGLEKYYDKVLRGVDGYTLEEVDVTGSVVRNYDNVRPEPGKSLHLTIDYEMQKKLENFTKRHLENLRRTKKAPNAYAAAVVALDPRSGAIRALLSVPDYNPNFFVEGMTEKQWNTINTDPNLPQLNRVIAGEYPPGSTFKIVTGSAAFEQKKVTLDELIYDGGFHPLVPTMRNAGGEVLGWLNFIRGLAMSDNVYFYELANRVGIDIISKYARIYGFGKLTGIDLPDESKGLVASKEVKRKIWNEGWRLGDTFNAAIGQGFNLSTPLQLAVMLSSVANGGIHYQPYLVENITNPDGTVFQIPKRTEAKHIDVSQTTLNYMQQGMSATTREGGTAAYFRTLPKPIAGKTGTAENSHGRDHGLFVAYGPVDNPELCVVAIVEQGGYGSVSAGPIVYHIFEEYFRERGWLPKHKSLKA
ncbi:MAG: penicillin-binding protein 2 [Phascolarctobacterium sp.]|nr:penicillin-binding protein 2 [Candidatus Phascolarctobacterium caballi]